MHDSAPRFGENLEALQQLADSSRTESENTDSAWDNSCNVQTDVLSSQRERALGHTAQYVCGIFRQICALISSLFLEVHKVRLRKSAIIRTQIFSESALAALCGIALDY